jgi:hypothetical protein
MSIRYLLNAVVILFAVSQLQAQQIKSIPWPNNCDSVLPDKLNSEFITYKGGLEIIHPQNEKFGGFSALWISPEGKKILAFSDFTSVKEEFADSLRAHWYEFVPLYDKNMQIKSISLSNSGRILSPEGIPVSEIESVAVHDNTLYIAKDNGKKQANTILKAKVSEFDKDGDIRVSSHVIPIPNFPKNSKEGFEAMTALPDGRLLLIHEEKGKNGFRNTWLINPKDTTFEQKLYKLNEGAAKGMTTLKNNDVLIIEKQFDKGYTKIAVSYLKYKELKNDSLEAAALLRAESFCLDNFEGIASFSRKGKEYFFIITDNNGDWQKPGRQKTLLLLFEIKHPIRFNAVIKKHK